MTDSKAMELAGSLGWTVEETGDTKCSVSFASPDGHTLIDRVPCRKPIDAMIRFCLEPYMEVRYIEDGRTIRPCEVLLDAFKAAARRELAEARRQERDKTLAWLNRLKSLMRANPDLPVEFAGSIGIGAEIAWMNGFQLCDVCEPTIETVAVGMDEHFIIRGKTEPDGYDPAPEKLDWYKAIVVRVV